MYLGLYNNIVCFWLVNCFYMGLKNYKFIQAMFRYLNAIYTKMYNVIYVPR